MLLNPTLTRGTDEELIEKNLASITADLFHMLKSIPNSLNDFNIATLNNIDESISNKLGVIYKALEDLHEDVSNDFGSKLIFYILGKLNYKSWLSQLNRIHELYLENQKELEEKTIFSNIIQQHPGIEHRAGVPIGGTFFF